MGKQSHGAEPWGRAMGQSHGAEPWGRAMGQSHGAEPWGRAMGRAGGNSWGAEPWGLLRTHRSHATPRTSTPTPAGTSAARPLWEGRKAEAEGSETSSSYSDDPSSCPCRQLLLGWDIVKLDSIRHDHRSPSTVHPRLARRAALAAAVANAAAHSRLAPRLRAAPPAAALLLGCAAAAGDCSHFQRHRATPHLLLLPTTNVRPCSAGCCALLMGDLRCCWVPRGDVQRRREAVVGEGGRGGGMAEAEALQVVKHVGDAVAFCHERGVVHCDIKPDNILFATPTPLSAPLPFSAAAAPAAPARASPAALGLSAPGLARTSPRLAAAAVRLADFGLAQVVAEGQRGCSTPAGTPGYMAPEVGALYRPRCPPAPGAAKHARRAAGRAEAGSAEAAGYGCAADVWSLGVTLYEMIAGERPYSGDAPQQGDWRARVEGAAWEGVSEECRALVSGMLRVRVEERLTMAHVCHHPAIIRAFGGSGGSSAGKSRSGRWW
ncbi:unnamed protein product [Closterium sp. NIES-64]|nr:unnamed protein product [Closterium sp. NIES-64]